ncbi:hypothetical protein GCM10010319_47020 [Streptomyces blastmyceticus]|uniref:Uncharacterized protein n=1 Tax=Streptomyces blastmyceticus TaxID=68180 RepID=A0ABP3HBQ7_9ACTN
MTATWRDIMDAAMMVGRDVGPWIAVRPKLSWQEALARRTPLAAYLTRRKVRERSRTRPEPDLP